MRFFPDFAHGLWRHFLYLVPGVALGLLQLIQLAAGTDDSLLSPTATYVLIGAGLLSAAALTYRDLWLRHQAVAGSPGQSIDALLGRGQDLRAAVGSGRLDDGTARVAIIAWVADTGDALNAKAPAYLDEFLAVASRHEPATGREYHRDLMDRYCRKLAEIRKQLS